MGAALESLARWDEGLKRILGRVLHGHTIATLAAISLAMVWAGSCRGLDLGARWPGRACVASVRRRLERLLANGRLRPGVVFDTLVAVLGERMRGRRLVLILDESDRDDRLRSLQLLAAVRGRARPLWCVAYRPHEPPTRMPKLIDRVLLRVARQLGDDVAVTLLVDRGLAWPSVVRTCRKISWHFVMRLQGQTRVRLTSTSSSSSSCDPIISAVDLFDGRRPLTRLDDVGIFAKAGFIDRLSLTIAWEKGCKSPWLLVSDTPAGYEAVRRYCRRMWCEQTFRDEKSCGLRWRDSRVNDPAHATRLLLVIALCVWLCLLIGRQVEQHGLRRRFDPHRRRRLSLFRLGRLYLQRLAVTDPTRILNLTL